MNYIQIDGVKIELTNEQVTKLKKDLEENVVRVSDIEVGDTFKFAGYEFVVLEHLENGIAVILKDLWKNEEVFGNSNKYTGSNVDELCEEFKKELSVRCGADIFIEHTVDLTSDDGLKDYGSITRKVSLLTTERYRRYVSVLDKHKPEAWWWLSTPHSTKTHGSDSWIKCVSPFGNICGNNYGNNFGVRPFCILKSNIFVSKQGGE